MVTAEYTEPPVSVSHIAYLFGGVVVPSSGRVVQGQSPQHQGYATWLRALGDSLSRDYQKGWTSAKQHLLYSVPSPNICFLT